MTYEEKKQKGICVKCGKESAQKGKVMCTKCAEKVKFESAERRAFFKKHNICYRCGKNKLFGNEKTCPECLAKVAIANKKMRSKISAEKQTTYYKMRNDRLKEEGLCRSCGQNPRVEGKTYCMSCLVKKRENGRVKRMKYMGTPRQERVYCGLCYMCGEPLDREGSFCKRCAERITKNLPKKHNNTTHIWRKENQLLKAR